MIKHISDNLTAIQRLIENLSEEQLTSSLPLLSESSIGQHIRHILEFYICLIEAQKTGVVCYDKRKRDKRIEENKLFALDTVSFILSEIHKMKEDTPLILEANFHSTHNCSEKIQTTLFRELAYNLEHSIHHQAIIKIGLKSFEEAITLDSGFGIAPATIRFTGENK